jgi:hypothetical protein
MSKLSSELAKLYRNLARALETQAKELERNQKLSEDEAGNLMEGINYILENLIPNRAKSLNDDIVFIATDNKSLVKKKAEKPSTLKAILSKEFEEIERRQYLDIFGIFAKSGRTGLSRKLNSFDAVNLKKLIAVHRLDSGGLTRKWKEQRLINFIIDRVESRSKKGDVFRKY